MKMLELAQEGNYLRSPPELKFSVSQGWLQQPPPSKQLLDEAHKSKQDSLLFF